MRYFALACDYDGTLAEDGRVPHEVVAALKQVSSSGRRVLLVTGREIDDLEAHFPELDVFDLVVAENGALLYEPKSKEETVLAEPPPPAFVEALRARGVEDVSVGRAIVATWRPNETKVLEAIEELGLEMQIIFNKGAVMVLPSGVNKATGLKAALDQLLLSPHNVAGIGDAENDHALLAMCEASAAVANALPALKERVDYVCEADHGRGVLEFIRLLLDEDLRSLPQDRHQVLWGHDDTGSEVCLPPHGVTLLITGTSGSGKSKGATGLIERLGRDGYEFCIIDPEGDYTEFADAVPLGDARHAPDPKEVADVLEAPGRSAVVNLLGVPLGDRPAYFARLVMRLQELRASSGRPHWLLIDEAHHVMPRGWDPALVPSDLSGVIMITVTPDLVAPALLERVTHLVTLGQEPATAFRMMAGALGRPAPEVREPELPPTEALVWEIGADRVFRMRAEPPEQVLKRHTRKYAEGDLGPDRSFYFTGPEGKMSIQAQNLMLFSQIGDGVDDETWLHHLRRGDYSAWFRDGIKDGGLADEVARVERSEDISAEESRRLVRDAIQARYTLPASQPSGWESDEPQHQTAKR